MVHRKNKDYLVGIASYHELGCKGEKPAVFTRVRYFVDWIKNAVKEAGKNKNKSFPLSLSLSLYSFNILSLVRFITIIIVTGLTQSRGHRI